MATLEQADRATRRMLEWRGLTPTDDAIADDRHLRPFTSYTLLTVPTDRLTVIITDCTRFSSQHLRQVMEHLAGQKLLLVTKHTVPVQTQGTIRGLRVLPWSLVLMYPLDHTLVPKHQRASLADMLRETGLRTLSVRNLPALRADDPIAQYLGLVTGDLARIERADSSVYWRAVINPTPVPSHP